MDLKKYKWKNRILLIETPNYTNEKYKLVKEIYEKNIKDFHKRFIKLITYRNKDLKFRIKLIGFDGGIKKEANSINIKTIFSLVDKMPLGKLMKENSKIKPKNLSLYSDYNKETTITGLGFKNKEKALYTIDRIKSKSVIYQKQLLNTMIGRANNHPYKNKDMLDAVKIFERYLKKLIE